MKRLLLLLSLLASVASAQSDPTARVARQWRQQHERAIVDEFVTLLAIPNVAGDRDNIQRNANAIAGMMKRRGIAATLISVEGANPVVFGEIRTPGATRTIAFYAHYDGQPLSQTERRAIADAPNIDADLMREFWLGATENAPRTLAELITMPSLNIRGMVSSRIGGQASNVIPSSATATIDMRLVKGMDKDTTTGRLIDHVRKQGFFVVDTEPSADVRMAHAKVVRIAVKPGGYNSVRTSMDLPISQEVIRVVERARGAAVRIPNMGASVPLEMFERALGTRAIVIPIANHDDNQHSFDENLRIQNLWDGIELMAALLTM